MREERERICITKRKFYYWCFVFFALLTVVGLSCFFHYSTTITLSTNSRASSPQDTVLPKQILPIAKGSVAPINKYPYFVRINGICGGSLLSSEYILTAAHCIYDNYKNGDDVHILIGTNEYYGGFDGHYLGVVKSSNIFIHFNPQHEKTNYDRYPNLPRGEESYDIAILKLTERADGVPTVSYPSFMVSPLNYPELKYSGQKITILGLGLTGYDGSPSPKQLLEGIMTIDVSDAKSIIHLSSDGKTSACPGDSGGPALLMINKKIYTIGIAQSSFCSLGESYYTSTSFHSYWIWQQTGILPGSGTATVDLNSERHLYPTLYPTQHPLALCADQNSFDECVSSKYKPLCAWNTNINKCVQLPP